MNKNIKIRNATYKDCKNIAKIHVGSLNESFLGTLGEKFLNLFYRALIEHKNSKVIVIEDDNKIIGFVSGSSDTKSFYKYFLKSKFIHAGINLLPKVVSLNTLRKILETLTYPNNEITTSELPKAELLSIALTKDVLRKGLGKTLFYALADEFNKEEIYKFKITVGDNLFYANKFYQKMGCIKVAEIEVHKGEKSNIYVFDNKNSKL